MKELLETELFKLLSESSQGITNEQMQNAYGRFMVQLREAVDQPKVDYSEVFR